jgi:DNA-binding winged helix-turn-helix (wHTH) protein
MAGQDARVVYEFGGFRLDTQQQLLFSRAAGAPVAWPSRVSETLLYFLERRGELLDKSTLMKAIWPNVVVEKNSLNQNISTLRQVLGETPGEHRYIVTVPGRGYRFVADVSRLNAAAVPAAEAVRAVAGNSGSAVAPAQAHGASIAIQHSQAHSPRSATRALQLEPGLAEAHSSLGTIRATQGRWLDAQECYQAAPSLAPDALDRARLSIFLTQSAGHIQRALQDGLDAYRSAPLQPICAVAVAGAYALLGNDIETRRYCETALAQGSRGPTPRLPTCWRSLLAGPNPSQTPPTSGRAL